MGGAASSCSQTSNEVNSSEICTEILQSVNAVFAHFASREPPGVPAERLGHAMRILGMNPSQNEVEKYLDELGRPTHLDEQMFRAFSQEELTKYFSGVQAAVDYLKQYDRGTKGALSREELQEAIRGSGLSLKQLQLPSNDSHLDIVELSKKFVELGNLLQTIRAVKVGTTAKPYVDVVEERFGKDVREALQRGWHEVKAKGEMIDETKLEYFLSRKEPEPAAFECTEAPEDEASRMYQLLAKMVLCAPTTWFEVITGMPRPESATDDFKVIGVAFDASSRLRRAGVEYYHHKLYEKSRGTDPKGGLRPSEEGFLYVESLEQSPSEPRKLYAAPPQKPGFLRVVAVSDTHLMHDSMVIPEGDLLVHGGDISYEEGRSKDALVFDEKIEECKADFKKFLEWFDSSECTLDLRKAMCWMKSLSQFRYRVLLGGNHDYILEKLGPERAKELCKCFQVEYLHANDAPMELKFAAGEKLSVWGSGISYRAAVGDGRAVVSQNGSFQLDPSKDEEKFLKDTQHLRPETVDVLITHGPPADVLYGKKADPPWINDLVKRLRPKLYLCGHAHNPPAEKLDIKDKVVNLFPGVVGAHVACTSVWNSFSALALVVDIPSR